MNKVTLMGRVVSVEERETKNGFPYHIVYIDDQEQQDPIPIALFGYERAIEEQEIKIEGRIVNRNGYPSVTVIQVEGVAKRQQPKIAGMRQPPPEARRPERPFTGTVNRDAGPVGDELPF